MNAILFPGQGSQIVGMGSEFYNNFEIVKKIFKEADDKLNYKISKIILEGPEDKLKLTQNTQPAILTVSYAIFSVLKKEYNFVSYKTRIVKHNELANGLFSEVVYSLGQYNLDQSFSHGDFGITNFLFNEHKLCLIDPIPDMFGCTELDAAIFCASLWINKYKPEVCDLALNAMSVYNNIKMVKFRTLVAAEMVRVYKYHPNKNFIEECVSDVFR